MNYFKYISIFISIFLANAIYGQVFYVSPTGTNNSTSGTLQSPWKTIHYAANSRKVVPGSVVYILGGTYNEKVVVGVSGSTAGYITFMPYANQKVIIDGTNSGTLFDIAANNYIRVSGLTFQNGSVGVSCGKNQIGIHHIEIDGNQFKNFTNPAIRVTDCNFSKVHHNLVDSACTNSWGECITFSGGEYIDVYNNTVTNGSPTNTQGGEGIDVKGSKFIRVYGNKVYNIPRKLGIYVDSFESLNSDIEVFNNEVYNCTSGIVLSSERGNDLRNVKVYNNIIRDITSGNGISIVDYNLTSYLAKNIIIENNTLIGKGISIDAPNGDGVIIRNNIIHNNNNPINIKSRPANLILTNNIGNLATRTELGTNGLNVDPLFVNGTVIPYDFKLKSTSPAINSGFHNNLAFDYNYKQRNVGANDIGAYEYNATTSYILPTNLTKPPFVTSVSSVVTGDFGVENKSGVVALSAMPRIDSINQNTSAVRFSKVNIPLGAKILNAYLKLYNFKTNFETFNCVKITAEDTANAPIIKSTAFNISSKVCTQAFATWNPFAVPSNAADTILTPSVDYLVDEIVSKPSWKSGNSITFLFRYYTTLKYGSKTSYAVDPFVTFDAYLPTQNKGAQLIVEYFLDTTTFITSTGRNQDNLIAFVKKDLNKLIIKSEDPFIGEVRLLNPMGQIIKSYNVSVESQLVELDIHGLNRGLYFVEVKMKNNVSVVKKVLI
jgi:hypothetical protein